ncbi:MAG: ribose-phosphate diphosphokinase [Candidatus Methylacidiphilales bacterium]
MSQTIFGNQLQIFTGSANLDLAQKIAAYLDAPLGRATVTSFPDGESFVRYEENIRGNDIFIVQPTCPPTNHHLMELFIMLDAAKRASAQRITAVIPFYGYARQDRKDQPRVPITAKLVANLLVSAGADRVLTLDLHAQQIQGFFDIPVDHLYAAPVFYEYLSHKELVRPVVVSPDVGGMKMAAAYANVLNAGLAIVAKRRVSATETKALYVVGDVADCDILLVDDMTETAGTITGAATILKESGARDIYACVSHAILNEIGTERLRQSCIKELITTNTTPNPTQEGLPLTVLGVEKLLGEAIKRIHFGESVSSLFNVGQGKQMGF